MPASSIDTFLASSIMIVLVLSAIAGTAKLVSPYIDDLTHKNDDERFQKLALQMLLSKGTPSNWGQTRNVVPESLGFASASSSLPYELDIDKVCRLNSQNIYSLTYSQLLESFGVDDLSFQIVMEFLFSVSINLSSTQTLENGTVYTFEVRTEKAGMPVSADLHGFCVVDDLVANNASSTSSSGFGSIQFQIPNSVNGTALAVIFAKAEANQRILAVNATSFAHNSSTPYPNSTFTRLSPLDSSLNVSLNYPNMQILTVKAFTYDYSFDLTQIAQGNQTAEYEIPRFVDSSSTVLVLTGLNGTTLWAEWVAYPQLPLQIGVDFQQSYAGEKIASFSYIVSINGVLYEFTAKFGGPV